MKNTKRKTKSVVQHELSFVGGVLRCSCGWRHQSLISLGSFAQVERLAEAHKADMAEKRLDS